MPSIAACSSRQPADRLNPWSRPRTISSDFATTFPATRSRELDEYMERIETARLERQLELHAKGVKLQATLSPVQRSYVDAMQSASADIDSGIVKFRAMADLFGSRQENSGAGLALHPAGEAPRKNLYGRPKSCTRKNRPPCSSVWTAPTNWPRTTRAGGRNPPRRD